VRVVKSFSIETCEWRERCFAHREFLLTDSCFLVNLDLVWPVRPKNHATWTHCDLSPLLICTLTAPFEVLQELRHHSKTACSRQPSARFGGSSITRLSVKPIFSL